MAGSARTETVSHEHLPWPVVHGAAAINFVCFGCAYAMVVLLPYLRRDLAFESWQLTGLFSAVGGIYFTMGTFSGSLTDRFGARPVVSAGMILLLVCLLLASQADSSTQFGVLYVIGIGVGVGLCYVPSQVAVQESAGSHASLAAGLASSGIGVGVMVVPPVVAYVLDHAGWRHTLVGLALLTFLGLLGCRPMRRIVLARPATRRSSVLVRSTRFTLLYIANLGIGLVVFVPMANVVPYVVSKGLPGREVALMLAMVGSGSLLGRVLFGMLGERVGARRANVQCAVLIALSFIMLAMKDAPLVLHLAMLVFGLGYGGSFALMAPTAAEVMGMGHFGGMLGALTTSRAVGILLGPSVTAILASQTTSYEAPYLIWAAVAVASAALLHAEYWTRLPAGVAAAMVVAERVGADPA